MGLKIKDVKISVGSKAFYIFTSPAASPLISIGGGGPTVLGPLGERSTGYRIRPIMAF